MRSFLQQFAGCVELLRALPPAAAGPAPAARAAGADTEMAEGPAGASAAGGAAVAAAGAAFDPVNAYRASVEAAVGTFLVLMTNMRWVGAGVQLAPCPRMQGVPPPAAAPAASAPFESFALRDCADASLPHFPAATSLAATPPWS